MERKCMNPTCMRPILGRSDKRYCCDQCRSAHFNDKKKDNDLSLVSLIPKIQKQNREILMVIYNKYGDHAKVSKNYLLMIGYNFVYQTHSMMDYNGGYYQCCFEFSIKVIDKYWVEVSRNVNDNH